MKLKFLTLALAAALTQNAFAGAEHNHSHAQSNNGTFVFDAGAMETEADKFHKTQIEKLKAQLLKSNALMSAMSADNVKEITVGVLVHETWIEAMKEQLTRDENGKYYENGAQFAVARIEAMFNMVNEAFAEQGYGGKFTPAFITTINPEIRLNNILEQNYPEFNEIRDCVYWPDYYLNYSEKKELCEELGYEPTRKMLNGKVDIMLYIREIQEGEGAGGLGGYLSMAGDFDNYRFVLKNSNGSINEDYSEILRESFRFGYHNAATLMHELGHVLETFHEVSEREPAFEKDFNRAWRCGNYYDKTSGELLPDLGKRLTIMSANSVMINTEHHFFYSDPNIIVEDERCGATAEADNASYVKKNIPLASALFNEPAITSDSFFVERDLILNRTEQKGTVTIRRTGDLTQPAYVNVLASDGTAWEQRDFDLGLKVVTFEAGESEKTIEFALLEREENHADTEFTIKMIKGLHTSLDQEAVKVTILSDKPLQAGEVGFEAPALTTTEGDILEVNITRANGSDGDATFVVSTANGTAVAGTDYTALNQTVTIKNGETSASVLLETTNRTGVQGSRTVVLNITDVTGANAATTQTTVTINDDADYGTLNFSQANVSVNENGTATLTISRTNGTDGQVAVNVKTVNGTAVAGTDFTALDQTVTLIDGQASASVSIALTNREGAQGARSFEVQLSNPTGGAEIGTAAIATVTINDATSVGGGTGNNGSSGSSSGGSTSMMFALPLLLIALFRRFNLKLKAK